MSFLKVLWNNLRQGPVTDPFPFGETYTPERLRGRVEIDASLCTGCGTCAHVCTAGAINIARKDDGSGFDVTVWRNTCCLCGQCRYYCPTKAITLTNNWHNAHRNTQKYTWLTRASITYDTCEGCGARMRFLPMSVIERIYAGHNEVNVRRIAHLCPKCRLLESAVEEDRACYIDHLKHLAEQGRACDIDYLKKLEEAGRACSIDFLKKIVAEGQGCDIDYLKKLTESGQACALDQNAAPEEPRTTEKPAAEPAKAAQAKASASPKKQTSEASKADEPQAEKKEASDGAKPNLAGERPQGVKGSARTANVPGTKTQVKTSK